MNYDFGDFIEDYLSSKFPDYRISGHNFMFNCVFCGDEIKPHYKKLGVNLITGDYHCFVCEENGDFYKLYGLIENLPYSQAKMDLTYKVFLKDKGSTRQYKALVQSYLFEEELQNFQPFGLELENNADDLLERAWTYLYSRKLFDLKNTQQNTYYVARSGKFQNRLIIPYKHKDTIVYFQGRSLNSHTTPKYLNPGSDHGIRSADILYPFDTSQKYVVVCEGAIDSLSLKLQGVNSTCTTGCSMSNNQITALKQWGGKIIIGYDNDKAGKEGLSKCDALRKRKCMTELFAIHPPKPFKDWNEAHVKDFDLKKWVAENTYEYNQENIVLKSLIDL